MSAAVHDDRILPQTRWISALIVPFLIAGFVILYLYPDRTEQLFAWTIKPRMSPLLMGAGYLAGAYFFVRAVFARRWHEVGNGLIAVTAFAWPMGLATLLHLDRFNHDHVSFWIWSALYLVTPLLVPALYLVNRRADPRRMEATDVPVPRPVRVVLGIVGGAELLIGLAMFVAPSWAVAIWPWSLTPLTARIVAGWFMLPGIGALVIAGEPRWSASRITLEGAVMWSALILIGVMRAWSDFDQRNPLTWIYIGAFVVSIVGIVALYAVMEARRHRRMSGYGGTLSAGPAR